MIVTGMRRALPFAPNSSSPKARGPLTGGRRASWAGKICPRIKARLARMTTRPAVRYNDWRNGETAMDINDKAPDFTLPDENGKNVSLKDFRGKTVVLFFFPKADTPG